MFRTSIFACVSAISLTANVGFAQEPSVDDVRARYGETFGSLVSIEVEFEREFVGQRDELIRQTFYWAELPPHAICRSLQSYVWPEGLEVNPKPPDGMEVVNWDDGEWCWNHYYYIPSDELGRSAQRLDELDPGFMGSNSPAFLVGWRLSSNIDLNDNLLSLFDRAAACEVQEVENGWRVLFHEVPAIADHRRAFAITFDPEHDWLPIEYEMFLHDPETDQPKSKLFPGYRYVGGWRATEFSLFADELHGGERWFPTRIETIPDPNYDEEPRVTHVTSVRINPTLSDADLSYELPFGTRVVTRMPDDNRPAEFYVVGGAEAEAALAALEENTRAAARVPPPILFPIADGMELTDASAEGGISWIRIMQIVCASILAIVCVRRFHGARKLKSS